MRPLRVLTWHVHGGYLWYLALAGAGPGGRLAGAGPGGRMASYELVLPVKPERPEGYGGRTPSFAWPETVREVPAEAVRDQPFDVVLTQSRHNWEVDRHELLTDAQLALPRVHLEHDPPREVPTDTVHPVDDPGALLVHVTHFNDLMWDAGRTPTTVVEHGVTVPDGVRWRGDVARGLVVVNGLATRGRRVGRDVFERARRDLPLDLAGMGSEAFDGLGDLPHTELPAVAATYRFFFSPIRYTSLGLAVCEALMLGMPVVGLATTELAAVLRDGETGLVDTDVARLVDGMRALLDDRGLAARLGAAGREMARERFGLERFSRDWTAVLAQVTSAPAPATA